MFKDFRGKEIKVGDTVFLATRVRNSGEMKKRTVVRLYAESICGRTFQMMDVRSSEASGIGRGVETRKCVVEGAL